MYVCTQREDKGVGVATVPTAIIIKQISTFYSCAL